MDQLDQPTKDIIEFTGKGVGSGVAPGGVGLQVGIGIGSAVGGGGSVGHMDDFILEIQSELVAWTTMVVREGGGGLWRQWWILVPGTVRRQCHRKCIAV